MATRDEIIAEELATDPLGRGYAGMSDLDATNDLNSEYRTIAQDVNVAVVEYAIRESLKWANYREKAELQTVPGVYDYPAMREFMDLFFGAIGSANATVNFRADYIDDLIDRMVAEDSMGNGAAQALKAFGDTVVSRAVELEVPNVLEGEVARNRP